MASIDHDESEKTNHQIHNTSYLQKPLASVKVKDMAQSARKLFHHHHDQKPTCKCNCNCSCGVNKKKKSTSTAVKVHEKHLVPKMLDRLKKLKNKEHKHSDSSSDSDNEITKNKK